MTANHKRDDPILVTGAAGAVGGIGRNLTEFLLGRGHKVRALVRREDERAEALRRLGAEVVEGDLTALASMHRAIEGCGRVYFGMSVSPAYLEATINAAAVARLDSRAKCNRALREPDLHVFAKLFENCLKRSLEAKAFSGREIGGDDDVLDFLVGHFVDVDLTRQPAS
jgi:nucleoside-diphosphate-sugar epimerase